MRLLRIIFGLLIVFVFGQTKTDAQLFRISNWGPKWSPNGERIAFYSRGLRQEPKDYEIRIIDPDGANLQKLSPPPGTRFQIGKSGFCWSSDAKKLAFVTEPRHRAKDRDSEIYIVNQDGTGLRNLSVFRGRFTYLSWSPDGTKLGCLYGFFTISVFEISQPGKRREVEQGQFYAWSPAGKEIIVHPGDEPLFSLVSLETNKIRFFGNFLINTATGRGKNRIENLSWPSPANRIFFGGGNSPFAIFALSADGKELWRIAELLSEDEFNFSVSLDGTAILFSRKEDIWKVDLTKNGPETNSAIDRLVECKKDCVFTKKHPLISNLTNTKNQKEGSPVWSPDGQKIAFVRDGEIWLMNKDGSSQKQLTFEKTGATQKTKK